MAEGNSAQMHDAMAWATGDEPKADEASSNPFVWFWEAVEGDFNENRSTSQIMVDAGISMIPLVDQLCDIRDLIANCRKLTQDKTDPWAWVALVLTLIGLFPVVGSLVKGVLKICFGFIRRAGGDEIAKVVEAAMSWVVAFLRRREVQKYLKNLKVDEVFKWLATEIKAVRAKVDVKHLTAAFDRGIKVIEGLVNKVEFIPMVGDRARRVLVDIRDIRLLADAQFGRALAPVHNIIDTVVLQFERQALQKQKGIVDVRNVHFRGVLPESAALALMRKRQPKWLTPGSIQRYPGLSSKDVKHMVKANTAKTTALGAPKDPKDIFPLLTNKNIESFNTLAASTITGPARMYRILAPGSRAMGDCWVTEEIFRKLQSDPDPKAAWRKYLAVWPDWNVNGQFVIYDIKAGESLNVWRGVAASQTKPGLPEFHLEGGYEQIVFNLDKRDGRNDGMLYYKIVGAGKNPKLGKAMTQDEVNLLTSSMNDLQKKAFFESHVSMRETINHPNISGPFETGWSYTEFDGAGMSSKIGLPMLPGQITAIGK